MSLKVYQGQALEIFESFLRRYRSHGAASAYETCARESLGVPVLYRAPRAFEAEDIPSVCLRVPTGGGKTMIAGHAIRCVNDVLLRIEHSLTLWLVPTDAILDQTLRALRAPGNILHDSLTDRLGLFSVLTLDEALAVQPDTLDSSDAILVATMQSFKQEDTGRLAVYKQNGQLLANFEGLPLSETGNQSLVDVLRLRRPFVIVDEAHNQGTRLAFDTLARLSPCVVLELTATPDRSYQPSNILYSVSATTLQAEDMVKLPVQLAAHGEWRVVLREAINRLDGLQIEAEAERAATGEYLRPLMLIQAERRREDQETFTADRVRQALIEDFNIPAEAIAVSTGTVDELDDVDIASPSCALRYVITVDKLREGWDCPFAYVLMSFRASTTSTALEQILGRVLRMPAARRKQREALNKAYAFAVSQRIVDVAETLRDGLVHAGFERQDAKDLIQTVEDGEGTADILRRFDSVTVRLPRFEGHVEVPDLSALRDAVRKRFEGNLELSPETGSMTLKGQWSASDGKALKEAFRSPEAGDIVDGALARLAAPATPDERTPSERGDVFAVPVLAWHQGDLLVEAGESSVLEGSWSLCDAPADLSATDLPRELETMQRASLGMTKDGRVKLDPGDKLDVQMAMFVRQPTSEPELLWWLERQLRESAVEPTELANWLSGAIRYLREQRGFTIEELAYRKFRLRDALADRIKAASHRATTQGFLALLGDEEHLSVDARLEKSFSWGRYAWDRLYVGPWTLKRHFYTQIGNLDSDGEEFECARFIANDLKGVRYWIRNIERKPGSFSLPTSTDRFYPDFLICMDGGGIVVAEYKGAHLASSDDSKEKKHIGEIWERHSRGRCAFAWVERPNDWSPIQQAVGRLVLKQ